MAERLFKIIVVGGPQSGKTSLIRLLRGDSFNEAYEQTIGVDFCIERYRNITRAYYRGAAVMVVAHSLVEEDEIRTREIIREGREVSPECKVIIVGTKLDLEEERKVPLDQMLGLALDTNATYVEASAKTGEGIEGIIEEILRVVSAQ